MLYLFAANEYALVEKVIRKTVDTLLPERNAFNYVRYDMRETLFSEIMEEALSYSFDSSVRVIIIDHASVLTTSNEKSINKDIPDEQIDLLSRLSEDTHLIFVARSSQINTKHKIIKFIENNGKITVEKDIDKNDWQRFVRAYFAKENLPIDDAAAEELLSRVTNLGAFLQEAEKLAIYGERVTLPLVEELVTPLLEENSFALVNAFISGDKAKTIKIYQDFKVQNQEPVAFIAQVGNQFRTYAHIYICHEGGMTNDEIASFLKIHPYRVKLAMDQRRRTSLEEVFNILLALADLDYKIKSGQIDRFYGFEMFLLNY
ncbi:MAG: DNA polymerase III subunit delta [Tenericutes bacterium ADurb.Bin087]|nr:MAG: DNA polymerase III subunit delta [Tenericutes bacterium ADurb.Bin087]